MMSEELRRQTTEIGQGPWFHVDKPPTNYVEWRDAISSCPDVNLLADLWLSAYRQSWHHDLVQYPLLKRLYELCCPNPLLYLRLQSVARHTPWATLDEVDGRYLIESFFFFSDHLLTLLERLLFLWYEGYSPELLDRAAQDLVVRGLEGTGYEHLVERLRSGDPDLAGELTTWRDRLYEQTGLAFADALELKK
jgi:hypothetical protein